MKTAVGHLLRTARSRARITQAELGRRMDTSQAAVAQLERPASNPTVKTLERALRSTGHRLELSALPLLAASVDESLLAGRLAMTPPERVRAFEAAYAGAREIARAGARARGELA